MGIEKSPETGLKFIGEEKKNDTTKYCKDLIEGLKEGGDVLHFDFLRHALESYGYLELGANTAEEGVKENLGSELKKKLTGEMAGKIYNFYKKRLKDGKTKLTMEDDKAVIAGFENHLRGVTTALEKLGFSEEGLKSEE